MDAPSCRWYLASRRHILGELYRATQSGIPWNPVAATWITSVPVTLVQHQASRTTPTPVSRTTGIPLDHSIVNLMGKYDHRQHELSDWLAELEQRFQLGQVEADRAKITWCQLLIGATSSSILASLEDGATWEAAKETLLSRLGAGSVRDEAWASLKQLAKEGIKRDNRVGGGG